MNIYRLENWSIVNHILPYHAPEMGVSKLKGNIYGHPDFSDGAEIVSSEIQNIDFDHNVIETQNSTYTLGAPDRSWVEYLGKTGSPSFKLFTDS